MTMYFVVVEYSGLENGVVTVISILKFIRCHLARAIPCRGAVRRGALHRMALLLLRRRRSVSASSLWRVTKCDLGVAPNLLLGRNQELNVAPNLLRGRRQELIVAPCLL